MAYKVLLFGDSHAVYMFNYLSGTYKQKAVYTNGGIVGEALGSKQFMRASNYKDHDLVLVCTSTNNCGSLGDISSFCSTLIKRLAESNPSAKIVTISSPGLSADYQLYNLTASLANSYIKVHNEQMHDVCKSDNYEKSAFIDAYSIIGDQNLVHSNSKYRNRGDTIHLNNAGYQAIAEALPSNIKSMIGIDVNTPAMGSSTAAWLWPVPGHSTITSGVGPRWGSTHSGIDISAPKDAVVIATRSGKVIEAGIYCDHNYGKEVGADTCGGKYGNRIYIDHGNGYISRYAHLTTVEVSIGDQVAKGERIGTVGSTGNSTGFHLHFEIRKNDSIQDPEDYVSYSDSGDYDYTSGGSGYYDGGDYGEDSSGYDLPEFDDTDTIIVGRRASEITTQPMSAFFQIYVGNNEVILSSDPPRPNTHQSLEVTRYTAEDTNDGVITGQFVLFDDNWDEIEKVFSDNFANIRIKYGYARTQQTRMYRLLVSDYTLSFNTTGVSLAVQFVSEAAYDNLTSITLETNTRNPTVAIKDICRQVGWTVIDENFDSSKNVRSADPFNLADEQPLNYINSHIIPLAQTENGEILRFYVDDQNVAYLKKDVYTSEAVSTIRTYIYQKGYDSVVKDIEFDIKGVFGGTTNLQVATELSTTVIDPETKEETTVTHSTTSTITEATGLTQHTKADQSKVTLDAAGRSAEEASNMLYYYIKNTTNSQYEASMNIIGDPTINLFDVVRVVNVTDSGHLHHTSGIYTVLGILDTVENGEYTTTLKLVRNGNMNENGPELINPKLLVK